MPTELPVAFARVLKAQRKKKGWSQMKLAAESGLHLNQISNLERAQRSPMLQTVFLLCDALKVDPAKFIASVDFYRDSEK